MQLSKTSWHRKFRDLIYDSDDDPKSICIYFHELVHCFLLLVLIPPGFVLFSGDRLESTSLASIIFRSILIIALAFMIGTFGMVIWGDTHDIENPSVLLPYTILFSWGLQLIFVVFLAIIFGIAIGIQHIANSRWMERYLSRKEEPKIPTKPFTETIVGSYLKSLYTKACPRITWMGSETKIDE